MMIDNTTDFICIVFLYSFFILSQIQCQITREYDRILINERDYINVKYIPSYIHNDQCYLTILYKCNSFDQRRISLSIQIDQTLYRTNFIVFRRHWFCQKSTRIQIRYIKIHLPRSLAYNSDSIFNFPLLPIEQGRLKLIMYKNKHENINEILKQFEYNVKFLPIYKRPKYHCLSWNPKITRINNEICPKEPEMVRIVDYPLVFTGSGHGKHFVLPSYREYNLRLEQQLQYTRPKFSMIFWLYIDEYCPQPSKTGHCSILQHLTFNNTQLTPQIFINQEGQITVSMFGYLNDLKGTSAQTIASIPKHDWCRLALIVDEYNWSIYINCLQNWNESIEAIQVSPINYFHSDEYGTFILGGTDWISSFRGFINQMDIYRRIALTYEQLSNKFQMKFFPSIIYQSNQCQDYYHLFQLSRIQFDLFNQRLKEKISCTAQPFILNKSIKQCLVVRTWKNQWKSSPITSSDIRYRVFRALRRGNINSTIDIGNKLYNLTLQLLENDDDLKISCERIISWLEQAVCYKQISAYSLLATFYQFGLCNLPKNSTRALELLLSGALLNDRISLLALGHRHFYGLDGVPLDYDTAYVYYQRMAFQARSEFYNPKPGEAAMEHILLTNSKLLSELTFDKSDVFYWLTQQAKRGVASAQHHLGSLMFQGRNGLTRNVQAAVEYFRMGAAQHDASSHFGYGLALLKGQGTQKNVTEAIRHIEKAVEHGLLGAQVALGYHAYEIEKNYTKAAKYWQECFDQTHDIHCAHNLGVMWTAGRYPPNFIVDHVRAWNYYSYAAQRGQIDAKIAVAFYNVRGGHPVIVRNPLLAAMWSRHVAEQSSAIGIIARRALQAYRDRRWHTSLIFYIQAALSGVELGYFNSGYLCQQLNQETSFDCIEQFLNMYLNIHGDNINTDSYALLTVAEYYQWKKKNHTKATQLYVRLYQNGDPQGLYNLAQLEEQYDLNSTIWRQVGVYFDEKIFTNRYRKLQTIYQHCRKLQISKSDESYIPCTIAYLRVTIMLVFNEQLKIIITIILMIFSACLLIIRR